ncbi:nucleotidyltransferase domain-containing protein, partial [Endothiovibrio diazotrophicus]
MTDARPVFADQLPEYRSPRLQLRRKAELAHLPEAKADRLRRIARWICEVVPVDWVILFGSYARGDWVEDPETGYASDYDLLVIPSEPSLTDNTRLWARLERDLRALADPIPVTLLVHPLKEVNDHLRQGQYFFTDIVKEGIALRDANRTSLAIPPSFIPPEQRLKQASFDLNYWFNSANEFWRGTGYYMA